MPRNYADSAVAHLTPHDRPLVIVDRSPLPAVTGGRQRLWNFLLAIDSLGPADLVVLEEKSDESATSLRGSLPAWGVHFVPASTYRLRSVRKLMSALRRQRPSGLARLNLTETAATVADIAGARVLIVAVQPIAALVAQRVRRPDSRLVVDLWDVEDARLVRINATRGGTTEHRRLRSVWGHFRDSSDVVAWGRFHEELVASADAVVVCSELDRAAMPASDRIWVIPNGADIRPCALHRRSGEFPTILYHGQLTYPPNVDAARILVEQVLPLLQASRPDVQLRLVGRADERVLALHAPPQVTVTGFVEHIEPELERAWLLIVPLRSGGGTRLKILESFAARLPVVSTTVGAEGLDVEHGRHLLIADEPADLAACALRLLENEAECRRLCDEAYMLVCERYDWQVIRQDLAQRLGQLR